MAPKLHYVNSISASEKTVNKLLCLEVPVVGLTCKGINVGKKGTLTLIAVSTCEGDVYLFDTKAKPEIVLDGGLIRLLQSVEIVKVIHDCSQACANLHFSFGVTLKNYFDTQTAGSVILESIGLPPRRIAFDSLCKRYNIDRYIPDPQLQSRIKSDMNYWGLRPVTKAMLNVAASEVLPLVPDLYDIIQQQLSPEWLDWFDCRSEETRLMYISPKKAKDIQCSRVHHDNRDRRYLFQTPAPMMSRDNLPYVRDTVPDKHSLYDEV
ncbi:egalitarian protein homolog [Pecten maximus]|uniref:egalitarian protein homolog n=1 Tax=Pecten maximus TaxID=6579 RepID=UPI001457F05C|nr:egalitarian protein homolog [Pecten maximus]XP_033737055.1 egalitarian protein homolog [Pecten maximus]XP_033737056.1 egalitarian protein homolog [Pecten maximus]